jgi:hypothetical protein
MNEPLVDLLLVRLGGEEEKKKVTRLLVTELDMTVGEAEKAVAGSPVVIRESVAIGEARVIQKGLYPYIDLLPRLEDEQADTLEEKTRFVTSPSDSDDFSVEDDPDPDTEAEDAFIDQDDGEGDDFLLTTASDEMLQIDRCHICGKTPMGDEKLAPCRTCGDLTCRDCFDRAAHVCHKCAADGRSVDRPVASRPPNTKEIASPRKAPLPDSEERGRDYAGVRKAAIAIIVLAAAVLFYFVDPLNLFKAGPEPVRATLASDGPLDTTEATTDSAVAVSEDTLPIEIPVSDPLGILSLSMPERLHPDSPVQPIEPYTRVPSGVSATSATDELMQILPHIEVIAQNAGIIVDRAALLVYGDRTKSDHLSVLVLAVNHPENNEVRFSLLSRTAEWLVPGRISQLVLFYRETRFHQPQPFSYTRQVFPELARAFSTAEFRDTAGTHESIWANLSGPVMEWICAM